MARWFSNRLFSSSRTLFLDTFSRKPSGICSAGRGRAEPLPPLRSSFFIVNSESCPHSLQYFLTVADPRLGNASIWANRKRLRRRQCLFCGLLNLDEVASFAFTTLNTQIVGASVNAVEMVWAWRDRQIVQTHTERGEVNRLNFPIEIPVASGIRQL